MRAWWGRSEGGVCMLLKKALSNKDAKLSLKSISSKVTLAEGGGSVRWGGGGRRGRVWSVSVMDGGDGAGWVLSRMSSPAKAPS